MKTISVHVTRGPETQQEKGNAKRTEDLEGTKMTRDTKRNRREIENTGESVSLEISAFRALISKIPISGLGM